MRNFNITQSYVDKDDLWLGIFSAASFLIISTTNKLIGYSLEQLVFGRDMIIPIKHKVDWELICRKNKTQINKDNTRKNIKRFDHDYKVRDKFMLNNHSA